MQFDQKLHDLFYKTHVKELHVPDRNVLHLNTTDPAHKGFQLISKWISSESFHELIIASGAEGVHAAPVFDPKIHKWVGMIDLKDFVKYIIHLEAHKEMACCYHKVHETSFYSRKTACLLPPYCFLPLRYGVLFC